MPPTRAKLCTLVSHSTALALVLVTGAAHLARAQGPPLFLQPQPVQLAPPPPTQISPLSGRNEPSPSPTVQLVPGSGPLLRQATRIDRVVWPYDSYAANLNLTEPAPGSIPEELLRNSNLIDHKLFVEPYTTRCLSSTVLDNPDAYEPQFVVVRPQSEVRVNATVPLELLRSGLTKFDARLPTTLLVHGFTQSYPHTDWLRKARALFEQHGALKRQNLIIMDWGVGSSGSYGQVAARASAMGSFLANFLMKLLELGAERRSIHLVGHSLGAHVVGFAGKRVRPPVGRITALDPAGPCFGKLFSNSPNDRLAPEDAQQVDVQHYDDNFLGLSTQMGDWDVYVNGGSSQPGAVDNLNSMVQALVTIVFRRNRVLSESHTRSTEVNTAELAGSQCQAVAYECRDWPAFLSGECAHCDAHNAQCFFMGLPFQYAHMEPGPLRPRRPPSPASTELPSRLFVATSPTDRFCLHHHQVLVVFDPQAPDLAAQTRRNRWRLQLELLGERQERANLTLSHQMAPNVFSFLMLTSADQPPTRFTSAALQVRASDGSLVPLWIPGERLPTDADTPKRPLGQPFRVLRVEINFMSHESPQRRRALSSSLCPAGRLANAIDLDHRQLSATDWLALEENC